MSCWDEDIPEAGESRHQVTDLTAVAGDEEVQLSWTMPEGWSPTDFLVYYTDTESETISQYTNGAMSCTFTGLANGNQYTFSVQAIYDGLISNAVSVSATPSTERFPVTDLVAVAGDGEVILTWTKPGTALLSYTLSYYCESDATDVKTLTLDADTQTYTLTGLTNDLNYYFTLVGVYQKGQSTAATVKAMPALVIAYFVDRETAALNQPVTFTFNEEGYPDATDVKWTFPGDVVVEGKVAQNGFSSTGTQQSTLSAIISGVTKTWTIEVEIREYVVWYSDWYVTGTYNGLKGACPVFSPDGGTVYIITFSSNSGLYAFDVVTGDLKWRYIPDTNTSSYNPLTVNPVTGDIYYGTQTAGQFYAVTAEGQLKWSFSGAGNMQSCAPAVNADGTVVYIVDKAGNVFALDASTGSQLWTYAAGAAGSGLLVNGSELVVGATSKIVFLSTSDGSLIAETSLGTNMADITGFAVNADKTIAYLPQLSGKIASVDLSTHAMVVDGFSVSGNTNYEPVVAPNGTVFFGSKDSWVYNVSADLTTVNWSYQCLSSNNAFNYSHPCVDSNNQFYITSGQTGNTSYIFSADGTVVESWSYGSGDNNQKQMGGNNFLDGVLYSGFIGSASANGLFVGKYVGGERASTWCSHGGDICGSCCIK